MTTVSTASKCLLTVLKIILTVTLWVMLEILILMCYLVKEINTNLIAQCAI